MSEKITNIDAEDLKRVRTIITHTNDDHPCADGVAAALILRDALPKAEVRFVAYNTPEHIDLAADPGLLFCDFTPPRERVDEFVQAGAIVLDHHHGAQDIVAAFGSRGVYAADAGVSGAVLASSIRSRLRGSYAKVDHFASLIGVRDTWQRADPRWEEACAVSAAISFIPWERIVDMTWDEIVDNCYRLGPFVVSADRRRASTIREAGSRAMAGGMSVLLVESSNRDVGNVSDIGGTDLVVGWRYRTDRGVDRLHLSLRSRYGAFDCSAFAKFYGGGGHKAAAGCSIVVDRNASPHQQIDDMIGLYLDSIPRG